MGQFGNELAPDLRCDVRVKPKYRVGIRILSVSDLTAMRGGEALKSRLM